MYKNRRHPAEVECRLFCCPILLSRCRFCNFLKLLSYQHTPEAPLFSSPQKHCFCGGPHRGASAEAQCGTAPRAARDVTGEPCSPRKPLLFGRGFGRGRFFKPPLPALAARPRRAVAKTMISPPGTLQISAFML